MTTDAIDRAIGQTPCICGDIETWHSDCYANKSNRQIANGMKNAYRLAELKIKQQGEPK